MLTAFGAAAVTFMMCMYALERRHRRYIFAFACGCALSSTYGFLAGTSLLGARTTCVPEDIAEIASRKCPSSGRAE
jgi:hypothetical protein